MTVTPADGTTDGFAAAAYGDAWTDTAPSYKRLDKSPVQVMTGYNCRRGRSYMLDSMDTGTGAMSFVDTAGLVDPTNTTGPFYPMDPNCPLKLRLWNPVTAEWADIFTGLTQNCPQTLEMSSKVATGTINVKDMFSLLAEAEIPPGIDYDDSGTPTSNADGNTRFASQNVDDHIKALLTLGDIPDDPVFRSIFSGNVVTLPIVYPPGTKILGALQDAADAEFPGVAVQYIAKDGVYTFHGRFARFDPSAYSAHTWSVGDLAYVTSHSSKVPVTSYVTDKDVDKVINAALFTPQGVAAADITGNLVTDSGSRTQFGLRGQTGQGLYTGGGVAGGDGLTALEETQRFGQYDVDNFKDAQTHVVQATFRSCPAAASFAPTLWNMLCNIEIGDVMTFNTTHPGGGGFNGLGHFVEGLTYTVALGPKYAGDAEATADVTLVVDLSPQAYFTTAPSGWT